MRVWVEFGLFAVALPALLCLLVRGNETVLGFLGLAGFMTFVIRNS